eukprot:12343722-Alexandrium_andersonii.AAC.1
MEKELDLMLPHQVFSFIGTNLPAVFDSWKGPNGLDFFWGEALSREDPHMVGHPLLEKPPGWTKKAIPLVVYGDAASFSRRNGLEE